MMDGEASSAPPVSREEKDEESDFLSTVEAIAEDFVDCLQGPPYQFGGNFAEGLDGLKEDDLDYEQFDLGEIEWSGLHTKFETHLKPVLNPTFRNKLSFLIGNMMVWTVAYWLGHSPGTFYKLYTAEALVLGLVRFAVYRHKKLHYYLLDFCYYANMLMLLHLWVLPGSEFLNKVIFAYGAGPLTWTILAFRNSLVYHDLDKVTSVFFHLAPACVIWTLRWHRDVTKFGPPEDAAEPEKLVWESAGFVRLVWMPLLPYLIWAVAYYLKIFVVSAERIKQRGYSTLFTYTTTRSKGVYAAIARRVPKPVQPPVYLFLHMCFCFTTFSIGWLCWHNFILHTLVLSFMGAASVWHGGNYYFTVLIRGGARTPAPSSGHAAATGAAAAASPLGGDEAQSKKRS